MPISVVVVLSVALVCSAISFAVSTYFVCRLAKSVAHLKASNNLWEYQAMERDATVGSRAIKKLIEEENAKQKEFEEKNGQMSSDGTLNEEATKSIANII